MNLYGHSIRDVARWLVMLKARRALTRYAEQAESKDWTG